MAPQRLERAVIRRERVQLLGHFLRRLAFVVPCLHIATALDDVLDTQAVAPHDRPVQRREAGLVARRDACAVLEQDVDRERVALERGPHERRVPLGIGRVNGVLCTKCVLLQHKDKRHDIAAVRCEVQRVKALLVCKLRIRTVLEQEVHQIQLAIPV